MSELSQRMAFAVELARDAGSVAMRYFQTGVKVEQKGDRSPVTIADRTAEELLRERIAAAYPQDGVFGEEFGERPGRSGRRWVVDPIDGTKSFVQGVPLFGVLVGLEGGEGPELGVVHLPALGETVYAARGEGCFWNGKPCRVSAVDRLEEACLCYTSPDTFELAEARPGAAAAWERLRHASRIQRGWGDCYGHVLVATGRAEGMFDPVLKSWDCAALLPVLEEAGGTFTDWDGNRTIHGGSGISTNRLLQGPVMALIESVGRSTDGRMKQA